MTNSAPTKIAPEDQLKASRKTLKEMNDKADRAIDDQTKHGRESRD